MHRLAGSKLRRPNTRFTRCQLFVRIGKCSFEVDIATEIIETRPFFKFLFLSQIVYFHHPNAITTKAATQPITIPAIAPPERLEVDTGLPEAA